MRRITLHILLATLFVAISSCKRDHLYYETSEYALIHVEIDWETLSHISPNGVSVYLFDSNGDRYSDVILSSDPNNVYLKLPPGDYTAVFHNNSISELSGVHLVGSSLLETFSIHANDATYDSVFETLDDEIFVDEPDDVVSYTLRDIHIDAEDVKYHYYKPDLADYEQEVLKSYFIQPDHIVHVMSIIAYFDGVEYLSSKHPIAVMHGMSGGYYFDAECTSEEDVMEEFEANVSTHTSPIAASTRVNGLVDAVSPGDSGGFTDEDIDGLAMVYVDCNTFGMHITDPEDQQYYLYIRFYLYDGTYTDYEINITDYIHTTDTGTNNLHTVELIITPLPDGGGEPGDGSWGPDSEDNDSDDIFDPSLDEWIDVGTDLIM
ncbi:MAG: DUF5119 domain-containing protein [Rikenellaceae bacterium]